VASHPSRPILRLRTSIVGIEPEIWRTIDIDEQLTLGQLHMVLQIVFGWQDQHLHRFTDDDPWVVSNGIPRIGRQPRAWVDSFSLAESDDDGEEDETDTTIGEALQLDGPLWYVYDFGDDWVHRIDLVERGEAHVGVPPVQLIAGEGRAPYEDSGGSGGYREIVAALTNRSHPEHAATADWVAAAVGPWGTTDPEDADLDGARGELGMLIGATGEGDMSGMADAATGVTPDSPIADFASELPVPWRVNLRRHARRTGILEAVDLRDDDVAELVAPYAWLIERIGAEGLTLTKAGWMPPALVLEGMTTLGWRERWIGEANREDQTYPMRQLRETAERLRLIRKVRGRLEVVSRTGRTIGRPALLAEQIARMLLRQRMTDGQKDASTALVLGIADGTISSHSDAESHVIGLLTELGYVDSQGDPLTPRWFDALTQPVFGTFHAMGLWNLWRAEPYAPTEALRAIARLALK
jgi:hypothetical protein